MMLNHYGSVTKADMLKGQHLDCSHHSVQKAHACVDIDGRDNLTDTVYRTL